MDGDRADSSQGKVFEYTRRVRFHETDAAGFVHFSKLLCFVEEAEHEYLESLGVVVFSEQQGWPRVKVNIDYRKPLKFEDQVLVELRIFSLGESSIHWEFRILSESNVVALGTMVTVRLDKDGKSVPLGDLLKVLK